MPAQNSFQLNVVFDVDSVGLTKRLVAEGKGYSILAHAVVQEDIAKGILVGHAIERPGIRSTVSLTTLKDRRNSRLALSWEKVLLETLEDVVTVGAWRRPLFGLGESDFERGLLGLRLGASFSNHPKHALKYAPECAIHWKWMDLHSL